jgi:hypothetical protein
MSKLPLKLLNDPAGRIVEKSAETGTGKSPPIQ